MKALRKFVTLLAISGIAVACGDDPIGNGNGNGNGGTTVADLAGSWTAIKFEFTMRDPPNTPVDLILLTGALTLTLDANGDFDAVLTLPTPSGPLVVPFSGSIGIVGDILTLNVDPPGVDAGSVQLDPNDPLVFDTFTLSVDQLTLSASDVDFDFTLQGGPELPATLVIVLNR